MNLSNGLDFFIRSRREELLSDDLAVHPHLKRGSLFASVSYAIGTSDRLKQIEDGGGVEPPANAVIASYFLKSHGGMHGVQSLMSLLSVLSGIGAYMAPSTNWSFKFLLIQRTLLCALAKHLSGLFAVATMSANSIASVGWKETRASIHSVALNPVSQYLFYCALLVVWSSGVSNSKSLLSSGSPPWWLRDNGKQVFLTTVLLGPILLREIVSTIWVVADVIVLYDSSLSKSSPSAFLLNGKKIIDAAMSLLLTPNVWRDASAEKRQELLACLIGKVSLAFEIVTGVVLLYDAIRAFVQCSLSTSTSTRPKFYFVVKQIVCARLYINFLIVRRRKVQDLLISVRGGAGQLPTRILDTLLEPSKAMGLDLVQILNKETNKNSKTPETFIEWITFLLNL